MLDQVAVTTVGSALTGIKLGVQIVGPLAAAYVGTAFGLRKFRSEKAFERKTVWFEELTVCCALLQDEVASQLHRGFSNHAPAAREVVLARAQSEIAPRITLMRKSLAQSMLYADGALYKACHALYDMIAEYETGKTEPPEALTRVACATNAVGRSAALQFRKEHGWARVTTEGSVYSAELKLVHDGIIAEAEAATLPR